jgi:hypothetical protein
MSHQLNQLMDRAETRILAHEIYTGGALTEFIEHECKALTLNFQLAYAEALARGLYRVLGEAYQKALDSIIRMVKEDIMSGLIETPGDFEFYFECSARNEIPLMPRDKVIVDLRIDTRQAGLYELLEEATNAAAAKYMACVRERCLISANQSEPPARGEGIFVCGAGQPTDRSERFRQDS